MLASTYYLKNELNLNRLADELNPFLMPDKLSQKFEEVMHRVEKLDVSNTKIIYEKLKLKNGNKTTKRTNALPSFSVRNVESMAISLEIAEQIRPLIVKLMIILILVTFRQY
ncbi:hypothetical protein RF11_03747 [Thelohanellus kitauei]|uniref:Uncharacterized protein n=1 Tax=Thelohanellus kitauei TaxID=669202 RepID=A0A0C2MY24_THEKT|nr:hypothetical protein RF11_03747 [Thelohanellus kitauei]